LTPYLEDILSQPAALRTALEQHSFSLLEEIHLAKFDRSLSVGWDPPILRPIPP
jgi:hypothetical protein